MPRMIFGNYIDGNKKSDRLSDDQKHVIRDRNEYDTER